MEDTYKEYEEWLSEEVEPETRRKYEKAKKKLEQLLPFENELVCRPSTAFLHLAL